MGNRRNPLTKSQARCIVREAGRLCLSPTYHHTLTTGYYAKVNGVVFTSWEWWLRKRAILAHAAARERSRRSA